MSNSIILAPRNAARRLVRAVQAAPYAEEAVHRRLADLSSAAFREAKASAERAGLVEGQAVPGRLGPTERGAMCVGVAGHWQPEPLTQLKLTYREWDLFRQLLGRWAVRYPVVWALSPFRGELQLRFLACLQIRRDQYLTTGAICESPDAANGDWDARLRRFCDWSRHQSDQGGVPSLLLVVVADTEAGVQAALQAWQRQTAGQGGPLRLITRSALEGKGQEVWWNELGHMMAWPFDTTLAYQAQPSAPACVGAEAGWIGRPFPHGLPADLDYAAPLTGREINALDCISQLAGLAPEQLAGFLDNSMATMRLIAHRLQYLRLIQYVSSPVPAVPAPLPPDGLTLTAAGATLLAQRSGAPVDLYWTAKRLPGHWLNGTLVYNALRLLAPEAYIVRSALSGVARRAAVGDPRARGQLRAAYPTCLANVNSPSQPDGAGLIRFESLDGPGHQDTKFWLLVERVADWWNDDDPYLELPNAMRDSADQRLLACCAAAGGARLLVIVDGRMPADGYARDPLIDAVERAQARLQHLRALLRERGSDPSSSADVMLARLDELETVDGDVDMLQRVWCTPETPVPQAMGPFHLPCNALLPVKPARRR